MGSSPEIGARPERRWLRRLLFGLLGLLIAVNGLAWMHARAMVTFVAAGDRTPPPDQLDWLDRVGVLFTGIRIPRPENLRDPSAVGLTFTTETVPASEGRPALEAWRVPHPAPRGHTVIFHGYAASKSTLLEDAAGLHQLGQSVTLVDFPGSGGSGGQVTSIGYHEGADVARTLAWLKDQGALSGPVTLYGFSMGSVAIMRAIHAHQVRPDRIILTAPFDRMITTVVHRFEQMGAPAWPAAWLLTFWGGVILGIDAFEHNPVAYGPSITCPTLILHGETDWRVEQPEARAVHAAIKGPARLVIFPDVGHVPLAEAQPARWQQEVGAFLGEAVGDQQ